MIESVIGPDDILDLNALNYRLAIQKIEPKYGKISVTSVGRVSDQEKDWEIKEIPLRSCDEIDDKEDPMRLFKD